MNKSTKKNNNQNPQRKLLPVGFYDLIFEEARKQHENVNKVLQLFMDSKYALIKTPLVEFEENFSDQANSNSFYVTDIISGKKLVFRNDITLQISRLMATRLSYEKMPLKLCYVGDVLCAKNDELYADRQQTQVGLEIIGCNQQKSTFEVVKILLEALNKLHLKNLLIEFSLPNFLTIFLEEINNENQQKLRSAIIKKDLSSIRKFGKKHSEIISKVALSNDNFFEMSAEILTQIKSKKIEQELEKGKLMIEFVQNNFPQIAVRFNIFGDQDSCYHDEIAFDIFCGDFSYAIAKGGCYRLDSGISDEGKNEFLAAVGATIYMNHLRKL